MFICYDCVYDDNCKGNCNLRDWICHRYYDICTDYYVYLQLSKYETRAIAVMEKCCT